MIKIGIDPSGTGTTAVAIFEDNKLIDKSEYTNRDWIAQTDIILDKLKQDAIINIEDCLYTSASASKDRDDLLKLIGAIKYKTVVYHIHFGDCNKTRKNNKIYNLKYKNIIKNNTYINKNSKIDTLKNILNKTL
ncbi:MAG: hypothetical protein OHM56_03680 [Spiroplasma phoeniceum]|nr:MAG: hypothetical protein OHM57_03145 [Spiroplasma phoeniceum]UZQ33058.1 MAG: hypothetical protein OHM56_03680 [Spiroplasma phoeniceum]